jgi:tetratricopeptide (TPR) repeat protein
MELLYNPDQMPESEVKETFVAREQLLEDLVELIKSQPDGAGVQHAVIIAPRGMGKTTVLLMVKFAVKDSGLAGQWQVVKFPEESYGIYDLADLWIQTLELIAADTGDAELRRLTNDLKIEYPKNDELHEAAYAAIRYWRRKHGKRLLLLVENFDQILEQINDERDNARLRDVLMNDGTIMILGGATNFFKEARAYDQPLYNFFKIYNLADLRFEQMQELLRRRAQIDRIEDFETKLKRNASRLRALEYFTGGNPRLVLMLYRVVGHSDVTEVRRALEKLLDEVTPYYKAKVEALPAQQRKILDHIARVSGETNEGLTPKEIAEAVRLSQNQLSSQLKRLSELGYVRTANLRGRSSYYTLSEPLYAIWHQMRFGRDARERMGWLIGFLRMWYDLEGLVSESQVLHGQFRSHINDDDFDAAHEVLEYMEYFAEAVRDGFIYPALLTLVIQGYEELSGRMNEKATALGKQAEVIGLIKAGAQAAINGAFEEALQKIDLALKFDPNSHAAWHLRGDVLGDLERHEDAVKSYDQALHLAHTEPTTWYFRGLALDKLRRYEDAMKSYDRALQLDSEYKDAWFRRGVSYLRNFVLKVIRQDMTTAAQSWHSGWEAIIRSEKQSGLDLAVKVLWLIAYLGKSKYVRDLISISEKADSFFPLARAIDYLQTGDEALIEKLSPEVRGIVEEVVAKLKETSQAGS